MGCGASVQAGALPLEPAHVLPLGLPLEAWKLDDVVAWISSYEFSPKVAARVTDGVRENAVSGVVIRSFYDEGRVDSLLDAINASGEIERTALRRGIREQVRDEAMRRLPDVMKLLKGELGPVDVLPTAQLPSAASVEALLQPKRSGAGAEPGPDADGEADLLADLLANGNTAAIQVALPDHVGGALEEKADGGVMEVDGVLDAYVEPAQEAIEVVAGVAAGFLEEAGLTSDTPTTLDAVLDTVEPLVASFLGVSESLPYVRPAAVLIKELYQALRLVNASKQACVAFTSVVRQCVEVLIDAKDALDPDRHGEVLRSLEETLRDSIDFIKQFGESGWFSKLYFGRRNIGQFEELSARLLDGVSLLSAAVSAAGAKVSIEANNKLDLLLQQVHSGAVFGDDGAVLRREVERRGGLEAVMGDSEKLTEVTASLGLDQQVVVGLVKQLAAGGVHELIRHTEMRLLWGKYFKGLERVSTASFAEALKLWAEEVLDDAGLVARMSDPATVRRLFKDVDLDLSGEVTVVEVNRAFPSDTPLPAILAQLLSTVATIPSNLAALPLGYVHRSCVDQICSAISEGAQVTLVHGGNGTGKSVAALAAAQRALRSRSHLAGTYVCGLKGVVDLAGLVSVIAGSLGLPSTSSPVDLAVAADQRTDNLGGKALLVLDNADALLDPGHASGTERAAPATEQEARAGGEALRSALRKLDAISEGRVQVVLTCRDPALLGEGLRPGKEVEVGELSEVEVEGFLAGLSAQQARVARKMLADFGRLPGTMRQISSLVRGAAPAALAGMVKSVSTAGRRSVRRARADSSASAEEALAMTLPENDRAALACLCVFPASFDMPAATAVARADGTCLKRLCAAGFVEEHAGRFEVPDSVRFALAPRGAVEAEVRGRLLEHATAVLRRCTEWYGSSLAISGLALFDRERLMLQAAITAAPSDARAAEAATLMSQLLEAKGEHEAARTLLEPAINEGRVAQSDQEKALALHQLGRVLLLGGRREEARPKLEEALALLGGDGARGPEAAAVRNSLGRLFHEAGDQAAAKACLTAALEGLPGEEARASAAMAQHNLANVLTALGERERAMELHEAALATREATLGADHPLVAASLVAAARAVVEGGGATSEALDEALGRAERAVGIMEPLTSREDLGVRPQWGRCLEARGEVREARREWERAAADFAAAARVAEAAYGAADAEALRLRARGEECGKKAAG
ncbi:unnamed protein product [Pedinophyceae sp. YPF-701]|nr:unnamed protein product [Pedinophyceae sp. YPF-701]